MSKGLKTVSWIAAMAMVIVCYAALIVPAIASGALDEPDVTSYAANGEDASMIVFLAFLIIVPTMEIICIVVGIVAATNKADGVARTTRVIMLTVKLLLIPFFLFGGATIFMFILMGIHPVLIAFGWGGAVVMSVCGWFTMVSGSIWAIATAVQLRRSGQISQGEMAIHIVLQFFFVLDVVDAIILFVRSSPPKPAQYQLGL